MRKVELLAPAKDTETGRAAILCGADAIYIGAERFSARSAAVNAVADLKGLVDFAHRYYARVYIALNTILKDEELEIARALVDELAKIDIDGLIIQDMAFLEMDLPSVPLIASTQVHNNTPEKVKFLEDVGFSRVILARELTLDEIRTIRRNTSVELECFVYGALCVSASGRCYMSYALGGRSGNRGKCAQPCRSRYRLVDLEGNEICSDRYLLSLKDLNLTDYIDQLVDIGIDSFKIEGRLKDRSYVANTVAHFNRVLNETLAERKILRSSSGISTVSFIPSPVRTFNRGFTDYGINGRRRKMGSPDTPKSMGEFLGHVTHATDKYFELDSEVKVANADGLCFFSKNRSLMGTLVNRVDKAKIFPQKMDGISVGRSIYRNQDHEFLLELSGAPCNRKIGIGLKLAESADGIILKAWDEDGNQVKIVLNTKKEVARNPEKALETIGRQLSKTGNSIFKVTGCSIELDSVYFFPMSIINQLRREMIDGLVQVRAKNRPLAQCPTIQKDSIFYPEKKLDYQSNILNQKARKFYHRYGVSEIKPAAESGLEMTGRKVMQTKYCLRFQLALCPGKESADPLILVDGKGNRFRLDFRCDHCGMDIFLLSKN